MFKDRDLFILGAGTLLAVFCLMLPFSFAVKVFCGLTILVFFMAAALMRFGPDRVPVEEWLKRRIGYSLRARKYTYQQPGYTPTPVERPWAPQEPKKARPVQPAAAPLVAPVTLALEGSKVYHLAGSFLVVVGIYFLVWLSQGGAAAIAWDLEMMLQGVLP